jgi:hypothetical protein
MVGPKPSYRHLYHCRRSLGSHGSRKGLMHKIGMRFELRRSIETLPQALQVPHDRHDFTLTATLALTVA